MPKISFVMPTKNRARLIGNAIKSIIDQTESDWELIIADDHSDSTDNTEDVVRNFGDSRIKYIRITDLWPLGISTARNFGNQFASSDIIAVADSDDIQMPKRAELTIKAFDAEKCDVFYGRYDILVEKTGEIRERKSPIIPFDIEELKKYNFIPHGSAAYKRELAYIFPYNSFYKVCEDFDLFTRLAVAGKKFYFCDEKVYRYILHDSNISGGKRLTDWEDVVRANRSWPANSNSLCKLIEN